jgi:hypothetical protein
VPLPPLGDIAIVVAGALVAGFVNGLSGTGYALLALGFWLQAMSPITAAPLVALCSVGGHVQSLPSIWHGVHWPASGPFSGPAFSACRSARCCSSMCASSR